VTGQGALSITGTVYAAGATLTISGNGSLTALGLGSQYILYDVEVTGNGSFLVDPSRTGASPPGSPGQAAVLARPPQNEPSFVPILLGRGLLSLQLAASWPAREAVDSRLVPGQLPPGAVLDAGYVTSEQPSGLALPFRAGSSKGIADCGAGSCLCAS
jgi:hypothetical protein